jgi:hypothetical protein
MRLLGLASLLLFAGVFQQSDPNLRPREISVGKPGAEKEAQNKRPQLTTNPPAAIGECASCFAVKEPGTTPKQDDPYDPRHDPLYRANLGFTIIGVIVALGGVWAIYGQTKATAQAAQASSESAAATARSAKATEDSVKLQEVSLRQWLNIGHWEVWLDKNDAKRLRIRFHVINPTNLPLDLEKVSREISILNAPPKKEEEVVKNILAPQNPQIVYTFADLEEKWMETLKASQPLVISVKCVAFFVDVRKKRWEQTFERFVVITNKVLGSAGEPKEPSHVREVRNYLRASEQA